MRFASKNYWLWLAASEYRGRPLWLPEHELMGSWLLCAWALLVSLAWLWLGCAWALGLDHWFQWLGFLMLAYMAGSHRYPFLASTLHDDRATTQANQLKAICKGLVNDRIDRATWDRMTPQLQEQVRTAFTTTFANRDFPFGDNAGGDGGDNDDGDGGNHDGNGGGGGVDMDVITRLATEVATRAAAQVITQATTQAVAQAATQAVTQVATQATQLAALQQAQLGDRPTGPAQAQKQVLQVGQKHLAAQQLEIRGRQGADQMVSSNTDSGFPFVSGTSAFETNYHFFGQSRTVEDDLCGKMGCSRKDFNAIMVDSLLARSHDSYSSSSAQEQGIIVYSLLQAFQHDPVFQTTTCTPNDLLALVGSSDYTRGVVSTMVPKVKEDLSRRRYLPTLLQPKPPAPTPAIAASATGMQGLPKPTSAGGAMAGAGAHGHIHGAPSGVGTQPGPSRWTRVTQRGRILNGKNFIYCVGCGFVLDNSDPEDALHIADNCPVSKEGVDHLGMAITAFGHGTGTIEYPYDVPLTSMRVYPIKDSDKHACFLLTKDAARLTPQDWKEYVALAKTRLRTTDIDNYLSYDSQRSKGAPYPRRGPGAQRA